MQPLCSSTLHPLPISGTSVELWAAIRRIVTCRRLPPAALYSCDQGVLLSAPGIPVLILTSHSLDIFGILWYPSPLTISGIFPGWFSAHYVDSSPTAILHIWSEASSPRFAFLSQSRLDNYSASNTAKNSLELFIASAPPYTRFAASQCFPYPSLRQTSSCSSTSAASVITNHTP